MSGTELLGDADRVAGIGLGAEARVLAEGFGLELPAHLHAVVETAGGQHNAAPRGDGDLAAAVFDDRPGDVGPIGGQAQQRGVGPDSDAGAQHAGEQTSGQRLPARGVAPAQQQAADALGEALADEWDSLARHPGHQVHPAVVRARWSASESRPP